MSVTCPTCDEEFDSPRRTRGAVECPACGTRFTPRRGRPRGSADRGGLLLGVMLALGGAFALAIGAVAFFTLRSVNRPDPPAPPGVVQAQAPQQVETAPAPVRPQQLPPRTVPEAPFTGVPPGNPQPPRRPDPAPKATWARAVGVWQQAAPVQGYPARIAFRPDYTGELTFDRGNGDVITHQTTGTVQYEGDTSFGVQLAVDMGMYGYTIEFLGPDRIRVGAGATAPEYTRVK